MVALKHHVLLVCYVSFLRPDDEDSARRLIENLNPWSVVNAGNGDLAKLPKDLLGTSLILIMNQDIARLVCKLYGTFEKQPVPLTESRLENLSPLLESGHLQN